MTWLAAGKNEWHTHQAARQAVWPMHQHARLPACMHAGGMSPNWVPAA